MKNEVEISGELVEEGRLLLCEECANGPSRSDYYPALDNICEIGAEKECRERAKTLIVRTLSAARDGEQKIPGEVGRWQWPTGDRPEEGYADWATRMLKTGDETFIALRREEASDVSE